MERQAEYSIDEKDPWEQLEGETNLWYGRFLKYCLAGPDRSLVGIYRDWKREKRAREGKEGGKEIRQAPGSWRKKYSEFRWKERAAAWDKNEFQKALDQVEQARKRVLELSPKAVDVLDELMGAGHEDNERRLAANSVLNRAGVVHEGITPDEEGATQIIGFRINRVEREDQ